MGVLATWKFWQLLYTFNSFKNSKKITRNIEIQGQCTFLCKLKSLFIDRLKNLVKFKLQWRGHINKIKSRVIVFHYFSFRFLKKKFGRGLWLFLTVFSLGCNLYKNCENCEETIFTLRLLFLHTSTHFLKRLQHSKYSPSKS